MTVNLAHRPSGPHATPSPLHADADQLIDEHDGWQALAIVALGRLLTDVELAAAEHLPVGIAVDLFFPHLDDASRHEALSALG